MTCKVCSRIRHKFCLLGVHAWITTSRMWFPRYYVKRERCARCGVVRDTKVDD